MQTVLHVFQLEVVFCCTGTSLCVLGLYSCHIAAGTRLPCYITTGTCLHRHQSRNTSENMYTICVAACLFRQRQRSLLPSQLTLSTYKLSHLFLLSDLLGWFAPLRLSSCRVEEVLIPTRILM